MKEKSTIQVKNDASDEAPPAENQIMLGPQVEDAAAVSAPQEGYFQRQVNNLQGWVKSHDQYGKAIGLNYKNVGTFKTVPGGLLSMIFKTLFYCYIILKWQAMTNKKDWRLTIQDLVSSFELLEFSHRFSEPAYQNISMGIQIMPNRPKQYKPVETAVFGGNDNLMEKVNEAFYNIEYGKRRRLRKDPKDGDSPKNESAAPFFNSTIYESDVMKISRHMNLWGMFEKFDGRNYTAHDTNVNKDLFSWKKYDSIIQVNSHGIYELNFNLSNAVIQGTAESIKKMDLVMSNYQLRANVDEFRKDTYLSCTQKKYGHECNAKLDSISLAYNNMKKWIISSVKDGSTVEQQNSALKFISELDDIIKSKDADIQTIFLHSYHSLYLKQYGLGFEQSQIMTTAQKVLEYAKIALDTRLNELKITEIILAEDYYYGDGEIEIYNENIDQQKFVKELQRYLGKEIGDIVTQFKTEGFKERYQWKEKKIDYNTDELTVTGDKYYSLDLMEELDDTIKVYKDIEKQLEAYNENKKLYWKDIEAFFKGYKLDLVLYDEVEKFRDWQDTQFNYPYQDRKTILSEVGIQFGDLANEEDFVDYAYRSQQISFKVSDVCTDGHYTDQVVDVFKAIKKLIEDVLETIGIDINKFTKVQKDESQYDPDLVKNLESCPAESRFFKLKYAQTSTFDRLYSAYYDEGVVEDRILTEFILNMNSYKTTTKRISTQFLDFLGSIGGFKGALNMFFVGFGGYFSAKFYLASISNNLFVKKKSKREMRPRKMTKDADEGGVSTENIVHQFVPIKISEMQTLYDTFLTKLFCCFLGHKRIKKCPFMVRQRILQKCGGQYTKELNIEKILKKVRDSYALVTNHPISEQMKPYLKFNKNNVIQLSDSENESDYISDAVEEKGIDFPAQEDMANEMKNGNNYFADTLNESRFDDSLNDSRLMNNIPLAYKRSLVQSLPFSKEEKVGMMEFEPEQNRKQPKTARRHKILGADSDMQTIFQIDEPLGKIGTFESEMGMISTSQPQNGLKVDRRRNDAADNRLGVNVSDEEFEKQLNMITEPNREITNRSKALSNKEN